MKIKKILGVFLVLFMGLVLVACKKDPEPSPGLTDADIIAAARTQLSLGSADALANVAADLSIPLEVTVGDEKVQVAWAIKETGVTAVTLDGNVAKVTRPDAGAANVSLTLVATLTFNEESATKEFAITVLALPESKVYATIKEMVEDIDLSEVPAHNSSDDAYPVTLEEVTIIGKRFNPGSTAAEADGFFVSDGTYSIFVYGNTTSPVGTTGKIVSGLRMYFNGFQLDSAVTSFLGETTTKTEAEVKALAKNLKVQDFVDTFEDAEAGLVAAKQNLDIMTFFKAEVFVYNDPTIVTDSRYAVLLRDTDATTGTDFIQAYYISEFFDQMKTLGTEAPKQITIWANVQEIRDNIIAAPGDEAMPIAYRVTVLFMEVELTDAEKLVVDEGEVTAAVEGKPHYLEAGDLTLPKTGANNSTISYSLVDEDQATIIDTTDLKVSTVPQEQTEVKLKATLTLGNETREYEFSLYVGRPTVAITVGDLLNAQLNTYVLVQAKVDSVKEWSTGFGNGEFTITTGTDKAIAFRVPIEHQAVVDAALANGTEILIFAKVGAYNGVNQLLGNQTPFELTAVEVTP